ncbi:MAG: hypothetical protein ABI867_39625 [Kofleriaceae bacterium]
MRWFVLAIAVLPRASAAEPPVAVVTDTFDYRTDGDLLLDGGLVVGFPTALPTGLSRGIGAGVTVGHCPLRWGARVAWVSATESTRAWTVTNADLRMRVTGSLQHDAGRGAFGLRLGLGGTLVHESRSRNQGERAGLTGDELSTSVFAMVPAADLDAVVTLHVVGPWALMMSGGPSVATINGDLHGSWSAELGIAWRP